MTGRFDAGELAVASNPWTTTVLLSLGLHVFGVVVAVGLPRLLPRPALTPVYVVDLVSLPGGPASASAPPEASAPAPAPSKPSLPQVPKQEKAIVIPEKGKKPEPKKTPAPKSTPKPKATATPAAKPSTSKVPPQSDTRQAAPESTPAHGASMSGVSGGTGAQGGGFGGSGAEQSDLIQIYGNIIQRGVYGAWRKPIYPPGETRPALNATFLLTLASSGRVSHMALQTSSGYDAVDRSFMAAIQDAVFPPLPQGLGTSFTFQIEFTFTRD